MMWVTYYLAMYPEMQEELRAEIESICGLNKKEITFEENDRDEKNWLLKKKLLKIGQFSQTFQLLVFV